MGYSVKSFTARTTDRRYAVLPEVITKIDEAIREIKG